LCLSLAVVPLVQPELISTTKQNEKIPEQKTVVLFSLYDDDVVTLNFCVPAMNSIAFALKLIFLNKYKNIAKSSLESFEKST